MHLCGNGVAESSKVGDATPLYKLLIAFGTVLLIPGIGDTEDLQLPAVHLRGVDPLEVCFHVLGSGSNEGQLLPEAVLESFLKNVPQNETRAYCFLALFFLNLSPHDFADSISSSRCFIVSGEMILPGPQNSDLAVFRLIS